MNDLSRLASIVGLFLTLSTSPLWAKPETGQAFDNWTVNCEKLEGAKVEQCFIFQNLVLKGQDKSILHIAVGYLPEQEAPVAILTLPLGISLPPGVSVSVDSEKPMLFPIERCEPNGCKAGLVLEEKMVQSFKDGLVAKVVFYDGVRKSVAVPISLKGFTAGFASLR